MGAEGRGAEANPGGGRRKGGEKMQGLCSQTASGSFPKAAHWVSDQDTSRRKARGAAAEAAIWVGGGDGGRRCGDEAGLIPSFLHLQHPLGPDDTLTPC